MKLSLFVSLIITLGFWLSSCSKDNYPKMQFHQTQCMDDTWRTKEQGGKQSVKKYFEDEYDIHFLSVRIKEEDIMACRACSCPSGSIIEVRASVMDTAILASEGFEFIED